MPYNWEGDYIIQNSVIQKKRYVIGSPNRQITTDIREWISAPDNTVMKDILRKLAQDEGLPRTKKPGDFDKRAMIIWALVAKSIKYVHDSDKQKKEDFWLFPTEVFTLGRGDCEDGTFLLVSLLIASGISPFCTRVALGEVFDENDQSLGGHCWPVYKNELGQWCILESTLDTIPSRMPEANLLSEGRQSFRYAPYYCFNNYHLWEIAPERKPVSGKNPLHRYIGPRKRKVNMKDTILPSGGWLSRLAQTGNDLDGRTNETKDQAIKNYVTLIKSLSEKLCRVSDESPRRGLYLLGYMLHSIQDLSTHKGITNAQHSYLSKQLGKKKDPDHDEANREKAREYTLKYLEFFDSRHAPVYASIKNYGGEILPQERLFPFEKDRILGTAGWDLTPNEYLTYNGLAEKYKPIMDQYPIQGTAWNTEEVFSLLIR
jgi:hypothetical protein